MHIAPPGTWQMVLEHGFWSTAALVEDATAASKPLPPKIANELVTTRREVVVRLEHPVLGAIRLNHNRPIQPRRLDECLKRAGHSPADAPAYYRALAERVFFWPAAELRQTWPAKKGPSTFEKVLLETCEYVERIWIDLQALYARSPGQLEFCQYNSGSTPQYVGTMSPRSPTMWQSVDDWKLPPAQIHEIAWRGCIPDVAGLAKWVERGAGGSYQRIWSPRTAEAEKA